MSGPIVLTLLLASGGQELADMPKPLQAYHSVSAWERSSPFLADCFSNAQNRRSDEINIRFGRAYEVLAKRYGEKAIGSAVAITNHGPVRIYSPCDLKKQDAYIDGVEGSVAALEAELEAK